MEIKKYVKNGQQYIWVMAPKECRLPYKGKAYLTKKVTKNELFILWLSYSCYFKKMSAIYVYNVAVHLGLFQ
jgi:hypothetical protein